MKKSERTRRYIIEKTAPVFNKRGFAGTSLSDIEEATGLTKGSLYGNFADKEEIALAAFQFAMNETKKAMAGMIHGKTSAKARLLAVLRFYATYVFNSPIPGGCPLLNNAVEADDHHQSLRDHVANEIKNVVAFIARLLDEGKKSGEFDTSVNSGELAMLFFTSVEGAIMVSRVSGSDRAMKIVVKNCKNILEQISLT